MLEWGMAERRFVLNRVARLRVPIERFIVPPHSAFHTPHSAF
jgi:hypothetical protein